MSGFLCNKFLTKAQVVPGGLLFDLRPVKGHPTMAAKGLIGFASIFRICLPNFRFSFCFSWSIVFDVFRPVVDVFPDFYVFSL